MLHAYRGGASRDLRAGNANLRRCNGKRRSAAPSCATVRRNQAAPLNTAIVERFVMRPSGDMPRLGGDGGDVLMPPGRPAPSGDALRVQFVRDLAQGIPRRPEPTK